MVNHISIGDISPRIQYAADGAQTIYPYPFPIFQDADMEVYLDDVMQSSGFTVSGAGVSSGGDVTFTGVPGSGVTVTLRRNVAIQRTTDFQEGGEFRAKVINDELDYQTAALQQVAEQTLRAVQLSPTQPTGFDATLPLPTANAVLTYNGTATGFANGPVAGDISNAQTYANNAAVSETNAGNSAATAVTSASNAATSETNAATSEANAAASAATAVVAKIEWLGDWSGATAYTSRDAVAYQGSAYICILGHTNQVPTNVTYWELLAQRGADGIGAMSLVDSGNGLTGGPITSTGSLSIDLDATPGLEFNAAKLRIKAGTAVVLNASGLNIDVGTTANKVVQLDGTAKLPAVDASQLINFPTSGAPTGSVYIWAAAAVPSGHLFCDGSAVSRTTYATLFAAISTTWGVGDGSTTFNVPDMRGRAPIGVGIGTGLTNRALADTGGEETHTLTTSEMPSHTHSTGAGSSSHATGGSGSSSATYGGASATGGAGGGAAHNVMQPFIALNFIIKT